MTAYSLVLIAYLSVLFFTSGFTSLVLQTCNFIQNLVNLEICMLGIMLVFILFSVYLNEPTGQMHALYTIILAAAESCFGLALLSILLRRRGGIVFEDNYTFYAGQLA